MIRFIFFKNRSFTIIIFWKVKCLTDCKGRVNIDWRDFGFSSNGVSIRWDLVWCKGSCQRRQWHPLQYSCLENPMDRGAWWAAVHGVAKSRTRLSDFTFTFHFHALEKEMATHSSVLTWRIPGTGEPGGLLSMGSHGVGHD